jgi:LAO/AO transport system kinase
LSAATREVGDVLDAFGFDRVIIETVGVGQSELDIARTADTSAVVLVPESGDSIQTLKAGLMEIADIFVVNKGDRPGADRLKTEIELMLGLRMGAAMRNMPAHHGVDLRALSAESREDARKAMNPARVAREAAHNEAGGAAGWTPPVERTVAATGEGVAEVVAALDRHFHYLEASGRLHQRRRTRLRERVVETVERKVQQRLWGDRATNEWLDAQLGALESGTTTPFAVADRLLERSGHLVMQETR